MLGITTLLVLLAPPQQDPAVDRVTLKVGSVLEGAITQDTPAFVELRLDDGTLVGFERKLVESIARGVLVERKKAPATGAWLAPRDQWYLLHDGQGQLCGRMHESITVGEEARLSEEWEFVDARGATELTVLEVVGADQVPLSCFYHERTRQGADERTTSERVVRATLAGGVLSVSTKTLQGDDVQTLPFGEGAAFPLATLARLRKEALASVKKDLLVFDPRREELVQRAFEVAWRRGVPHQGKTIDVRELRSQNGKGWNVEWLDGAGTVLRREVNGQALVAVPANAEQARGVRTFTGKLGEAARCMESQGRFGLWLPNPSWRAGDAQDGQVKAECASAHATAQLLVLDHLDKDITIESASRAVQRWLLLAHPDWRAERSTQSRVRQAQATTLEGTLPRAHGAVVVPHRCRVHVFASGATFLALVLDAPAQDFDQLAPDFARIVASVELR